MTRTPTPQSNFPIPNPSDKTLAGANHIISIFLPLWVPFVIWTLTPLKKYPFLKAHARQAAIEGIVWKAALFFIGLASLIYSITRIVFHYQNNWETFTWQEVGWRIVLSLSIFAALWIFNLIQSLFQARSAFKGNWPKSDQKKFNKGTHALQQTPTNKLT